MGSDLSKGKHENRDIIRPSKNKVKHGSDSSSISIGGPNELIGAIDFGRAENKLNKIPKDLTVLIMSKLSLKDLSQFCYVSKNIFATCPIPTKSNNSLQLNPDNKALINDLLILGAEKGNIWLVDFLLSNYKISNTTMDYALVHASIGGYLDIIKYLIDHGSLISFDNYKSLQAAIMNDHLDVVKYLMGAIGRNASVFKKAIMWAQEYKREKIIHYLSVIQ